jgi:hypothetical protein
MLSNKIRYASLLLMLVLGSALVLGGCLPPNQRYKNSRRKRKRKIHPWSPFYRKAHKPTRPVPSKFENETRFKSMSFASMQTCKLPPAGEERKFWYHVTKGKRYSCDVKNLKLCYRQFFEFVELLRDGDKYRVTKIQLAVRWGVTPEIYAKLPIPAMGRKGDIPNMIPIRLLKELKYRVYMRNISVGFAGMNVPNYRLRQPRGKRKTKGYISGGGKKLKFTMTHHGNEQLVGPPTPLWMIFLDKIRKCPNYIIRSINLIAHKNPMHILAADKTIISTEGLVLEISKPLRDIMNRKLKSLGFHRDRITFHPTGKSAKTKGWKGASFRYARNVFLSNTGPIRGYHKMCRWIR